MEQHKTPRHTAETEFPGSPTTQQTPRTLRRLDFSKPKSRFAEVNYPHPTKSPMYREIEGADITNDSSSDDDDEDDIWHLEHEEERDRYKKNNKRCGSRIITEWIFFIVITTGLICSLTVKSMKDQTKWGLETWKWALMIMVIFSGRLFSGWVIAIIVFFIEKNFMLREKVLYFVYGLSKSFQNCIWLALVLLSWSLMALIAVLVGATIWLIKTVLVKVLASSFHVATFFDRMKESVFHHYILDSLSGPARGEIDQTLPAKRKIFGPSRSMPTKLKEGEKVSAGSSSRKIDIERLRKLSRQSTASAWSIRRLVNYVMYSGLSTISRTVDNFETSEITSEWEARVTAQRVFKHVAKPDAKYILEEDLLRFLRREDIRTILPFFDGAVETGQIKKSAFRNWATSIPLLCVMHKAMIVEEMNILTTVFLKVDMEKVYYPNSVLSTKPISNFYRSPDMLDYVDFMINSSTSSDKINLLKKEIQTMFYQNGPTICMQEGISHCLIALEVELYSVNQLNNLHVSKITKKLQ
ncbi:hypothetical protein MKW94_021942 [Papaver nudicaule]|uniref:Mechanosensitive ion channel protein n=1 Tax=Papaver nudicaule TaxID=74823 RepID=A0AA42AZ30_PAPNU|nr:hypothetical protein [Papaver nudicaule]